MGRKLPLSYREMGAQNSLVAQPTPLIKLLGKQDLYSRPNNQIVYFNTIKWSQCVIVNLDLFNIWA